MNIITAFMNMKIQPSYD